MIYFATASIHYYVCGISETKYAQICIFQVKVYLCVSQILPNLTLKFLDATKLPIHSRLWKGCGTPSLLRMVFWFWYMFSNKHVYSVYSMFMLITTNTACQNFPMNGLYSTFNHHQDKPNLRYAPYFYCEKVFIIGTCVVVYCFHSIDASSI